MRLYPRGDFQEWCSNVLGYAPNYDGGIFELKSHDDVVLFELQYGSEFKFIVSPDAQYHDPTDNPVDNTEDDWTQCRDPSFITRCHRITKGFHTETPPNALFHD